MEVKLDLSDMIILRHLGTRKIIELKENLSTKKAYLEL